MKYLNSSFSIEPAKKLDGLACPRCALGPKWGEHTKDCPLVEALRLFTQMDGERESRRIL